MIAILSLMFFFSTAFAQAPVDDPCKPQDPPKPECASIEAFNLGGGYLNVRSAPNTSAKILGTIKQGTILKAKSALQADGWLGVEYKAAQAYLSATYARCSAATVPTPEPKPSAYAWTVPSSKRVVQGFENPIKYQTCGFHTGIDIGAVRGADIVSLADGKVIHVGHLWLQSSASEPTCSNGKSSGSGRGPYSVVIDHGNGMYSTYGHNSRTIVKIGDQVTSGQKIGEIGNLGYSCGPHLHLEVLTNTAWTGNWSAPFTSACGKYVDPLNYAKKP